MRSHRHSSQRPAVPVQHRGVAAIETALILPLLVILVFGAVELSNAIFMKQSLNMAAYEAAKVITRPGDNNTLATTRCQEVLTVRKISTYTLTITPAVTATTARGTQITVTVQAPASNLSYGPLRFMSGRTVRSSAVMVRL
jgi:Flp pilus assembly protein TadG